MSNNCKSQETVAELRGGASPISLRVGGGRSAWLSATLQGNQGSGDYSGLDVELWGDFGGGNALLKRQRMGPTLPDSTLVLKWAGGWFFSYEVRIINRTTTIAPKNAPKTAWTLHSWDGDVAANPPCGFTRTAAFRIGPAAGTPTLLLPGAPDRRRAMVSFLAVGATDYLLIGESAAAAAAGVGFPLAGGVPAGAAFAPRAPWEIRHTNEVWVNGVAAAPGVFDVRVFTESE